MIYSISNVAEVINASYDNLTEANISVLLTDSRSLTFPEESLFFALVTSKNDGHRFIGSLYDKGVRNFVVSNEEEYESRYPEANFLQVKDTLTALQNISKHHRMQFSIPVIAITGSNGKTIVKEWLYQLMHKSKSITRSPRSYNSQIGVPLSVWQLNGETELGIFEAGISKPDEMDKLADIIRPTIGILTNIGDTHQENFNNNYEKLYEKLSLFRSCDMIIYNGDDAILSKGMEETCLLTRAISWSKRNRQSAIYISGVEKGETSTHINYMFLGMEGEFDIPFIEDASIENALHCLAVMLTLGISNEHITREMCRLEPVAMRLEVLEGKNNCLIINDSYNSDINSLEIALDFQMRRSSPGRRNVLILSDLLQTGMLPKSLYRKIADLCKRKKVDKIIGIGRDLCEVQWLFNIEGEFYQTTEDFLSSGSPERFNNELVLIKGARHFHFEDISERLELKKHETILEVNLDAIVHNFNAYKSKLKPETKITCMVKAFGYGAGSYELAKTLQDHGCDYLAVAVVDEGADLRKQGITSPIMVMNPEMSTLRSLFINHLEPEIYSFRILEAVIHEAKKLGITNYPVHIKIDSGMHRMGFMESEIDELLERLDSQSSVIVKSVFSHLAGADSAEFDSFTKSQFEVFGRCSERIAGAFPHKIIRHILNTAGIERFADHQLDMVRLGIGLYGIESSDVDMGLRNVSTLKSTILQIKDIPQTETVGYSRKGILKRDSRIAMIPIGYADGFDRHLGNGNAHILVNGTLCPTIGNICMDILMLDVTDAKCKEGDQVIIFGDEPQVCDISKALSTIPYEIVTGVSSRVKRVYYRE